MINHIQSWEYFLSSIGWLIKDHLIIESQVLTVAHMILQIPSDLLQKVSLWPFHARDDGLRRCRLGGYGSPHKIQCLVTWYMEMDMDIIYDIWVSTNNTNIMGRSCHL